MRYIILALVALFMFGPAYAADNTSMQNTDDSHPGTGMRADRVDGWDDDAWDTNDDDTIDKDEFYAGYKNTELFEDWDTNDDGVLDEEELGEGLYDSWDYDDDGILDDDELEEMGFWDW